MKLFNCINTDLQFTSEVEEEFPNRRLPTLDLELWQDEVGRIRYSYFEKKMSNKYCIMKKTALPSELKKSVLVAEATRRLFNMEEMTEDEEKIKELDRFNRKMKISGYKIDERRRIIADAVVGFTRKVDRCKKNNAPLHRDASKGIMARKIRRQ